MKNITTDKKVFMVLGLFIMILASSCKKFEEVGSPATQLTADKVYTDSTSIVAASLALYGCSQTNSGDGFIVSANEFGSMCADDAYLLIDNGISSSFASNTLSQGNISNVMYNDPYTVILYANSIISGLSNTTAISSGLKNQLTGEAKFFRAYLYFYLVNYYGDVPLVLNTDALNNAHLPRTPKAQVYQQIIKDLTDAKSLLTDTYPSDEMARINKKAVSAFLARVYLYLPTPNYVSAEAEATEVINSDLYSLDELANVFLKTSTETIWQVESDRSGGIVGVTRTGSAFLPSGSTPKFVLYTSLVNAFEPNDQRKNNWTKTQSYGGSTFYYPYKYKNRNTSVNGNEYSVMLRLGEVFLNRAEARAQQNNIAGAQADLNKIRNRAGLLNAVAANQAAILSAIAHERWVELFAENSDRWFSLKRTGKIDAVLPVTKAADIPNYSWQPFQALYPIPADEILANPTLKQNPGY